MKIKDDFKKIHGFNYSINSQGVCRNDSTKRFLTPHSSNKSGAAFTYKLRKSGAVTFRSISKLLKRPFDEFEAYDVVSLIGGKKQLWNKAKGTPLEVSRGCMARFVGKEDIYFPKKKGSSFVYLVEIDGHKKTFKVDEIYKKAFNKRPPSNFATKEIKPKEKPGPKEKPTVEVHCPYAENMIQPLYGKMGAEFSPLDWYHQQLPEAVMVGGR